METKSPHIEERKHYALQMQLTVCKLLKWTEEDYCWYQYETMLQYIKHRFLPDRKTADSVRRSEIFRKWWLNHWCNRDAAFVESFHLIPAIDPQEPELIYKELHDPRTLAAAIYPNGIILKESIKSIFNPKTVTV